MSETGIVRKRNLPHIDIEGKPTFITACLAGSIPAAGLRRITRFRQELDNQEQPQELSEVQWNEKKHKLTFKLVDSMLDGEPSVNHLADERLAELVQSAFLYFANVRYHLFAFVVMPSHHHWVFLPKQSWVKKLVGKDRLTRRPQRTPRETISHSIQSYTSNQCNRILGRTGSFWQTETFDHYVRDEGELLRIINYIEQNPVTAGLVSKPEDYQWSSARLREKLGIEPGAPIVA